MKMWCIKAFLYLRSYIIKLTKLLKNHHQLLLLTYQSI